jgi:hypothetical protein
MGVWPPRYLQVNNSLRSINRVFGKPEPLEQLSYNLRSSVAELDAFVLRCMSEFKTRGIPPCLGAVRQWDVRWEVKDDESHKSMWERRTTNLPARENSDLRQEE